MERTARRLFAPPRIAARPLGSSLAEWGAALVGALIVVLLLLDASPDALRVTAVFLALGALVAALSRGVWPLGCVCLVATWWLAVVLGRYLPNLINPWPSVANTVGGAAYFGTPYQGPQIGAALSVATPILIALAAAAFVAIRTRRDSRMAPAGADAAPSATPDRLAREAGRPRALIVTWVGGAIIAVTLVPNLRAWLHQESSPLIYGWDLSNITAWQGFVQMGLTPMKDFFYPYGFQWLYGLRSFGPLIQWLTQIAMLAAAAWALLRLTGGRTVRVLVCLVTVVLIGAWNPEWLWRYLPALLVPVTYGALGPAVHRRITRHHWIFGSVCLLAALIEPDLLALGLVGVACVLAGEVVAGRLSWDGGRLLLRGVVDLAPVVTAGVILLLIWVVTGTAAGNLRFYAAFSTISASSALNEDVLGPPAMLMLHPNTYSTAAAIPALLCVAGLLWARFGGSESRGLPTILLGGAGVSLTLLLKDYVRPIGDLVLLPGLVTLAWSLILVWGRSSLVRALTWGAGAAAMLCLLNEAAGATHYLDTAVSSPVNAARSVGVVFDRGARARAANAEFSPARFPGWPDAANAAFYATSVDNQPLRFAIVGDSPMTYVLFHQSPPYQTDMYAGWAAEQRAMLSDVRSRPPWYVIWSKSFFQDGLPYSIRDPLIFSWMIKNYVPYRVSAGTDILRRRRSGERIPAAFWSSQLGSGVDLKYIPSESDAVSAPPCDGGPGCVRYALVRGHGAPGPKVSVRVSGNGHTYPVSFRLRRGVSVYPIRLDRLWFSAVVGSKPTVTATTRGFTATDAGRRSGGNLY